MIAVVCWWMFGLVYTPIATILMMVDVAQGEGTLLAPFLLPFILIPIWGAVELFRGH